MPTIDLLVLNRTAPSAGPTCNPATGTFAPFSNPSAPSNNGTQRTVTDLGASGAAKFFRVEISKP